MSGVDEDFVRKNALMMERITVERAFLQIPDEIFMNPHRKVHVLADNPTSRKPLEATAVDTAFVEASRKAHMTPRQKYSNPITETQEIGWISTPLVWNTECDYRRRQTDVTQNVVFPTKVKDKKEEK